MVHGIEFMLEILNTTTMKQYGTVWKGRPHPACKAHEFLSGDYWKCVLPKQVGSAHRGVGTCSLGSVVDSKFRVQGISNLRVVDASVFPATPNANINAAVMIIAEKASSDIKRDWAAQPF